jgi:hypothetical protein
MTDKILHKMVVIKVGTTKFVLVDHKSHNHNKYNILLVNALKVMNGFSMKSLTLILVNYIFQIVEILLTLITDSVTVIEDIHGARIILIVSKIVH